MDELDYGRYAMTGANDSSLFGNNDELYNDESHSEEYEPFARTLTQSNEPLFPNAGNQSWGEPQRPAYLDNAVNGQSHDGQGTNGHSYNGQGYNGHYGSDDVEAYARIKPYPAVQHESDLYALPVEEVEETPTVPYQSPATPYLDLPEENLPAADALVAAPAADNVQPYPYALDDYARIEKEARFKQQFAQLNNLIQHGAWPQALERIQKMRVEYPDVEILDALYEEAALKTELMALWTPKIKGRRLTVGQEWLIRRSLPFLMLFLLFTGGIFFYRTYVAPSRQVLAMERANQALIEEATSLLQVGHVDEAIRLYNEVLERNPDNAAARQGLVDASHVADLAVSYDLAIRIANKGNLERALLLLQSVKAKSPSFRDIDARIARVSTLLEAEAAYNYAERYFAQRRWVDAITYYEKTQVIAPDYQAVRVGLQLKIAYFMASQRLMTQWPTPTFGTEQIRTFLRRAQEVNGPNETITAFLGRLDTFMKGERSLNRNNLDQAITTWRELYDVQPDFLGGYLAEQLYRSYLALAAEVRNDDTVYAVELYTLAANMPVRDSSEARAQLQSLGVAVPVAQPTPMPQPTIAFIAPPAEVIAAAQVVPVEASAPELAAAPTNNYSGWILFRSTRTGWEDIYIMRADGSDQQLAPDKLRYQIDTLYQKEQRTADGRMVFVQSAPGRSDANIFLASSDGTNIMITDGNSDEYDPVWSPAGDRIAYVGNQTGNDEIWVMRADGSEQQQLTMNEWEWDKHPTWSPDGTSIAFFSNRSGQRQIWVMDSNGGFQRNLSNNIYDDWDPVWIK
jgi:tetratricopeptide (TPR) repeat protein